MKLTVNAKLRKGILIFLGLLLVLSLVLLILFRRASGAVREKVAADVFASAKQLYELGEDVDYGCQDPYYLDQANLLEYQAKLLGAMNFKCAGDLESVAYSTQRLLSMIQRQNMDSEAARQCLAQATQYLELILFDAQGRENTSASQLKRSLNRLNDTLSASDDSFKLREKIEALWGAAS